MKLDEMLRDAREPMGARTVSGEPIVRNGVTALQDPWFRAGLGLPELVLFALLGALGVVVAAVTFRWEGAMISVVEASHVQAPPERARRLFEQRDAHYGARHEGVMEGGNAV